jgi:replicative DNA helicase
MATADRTSDRASNDRSASNRADGAHAREKPPADLLDRRPPSSIEAEKGVLGSILLLPEVLDDVALAIRTDDFYDDTHQKLFAHMLALNDAGRPIDVTLLVERLKNHGHYELVGGVAYISELIHAVPHAASAVYYAQIVKDKAMKRALILGGTEILREAYDETLEAREMINRAEEKIFSIMDRKGAGDLSSIRDVLLQAMDRINARMDHAQPLGGVPSGFTDLDGLLGGLHDSELLILAARPSMGKTALAMNIAEHASIKHNAPTLFVSLEMSSIELADRLLCSVARVNGQHLRDGSISQDDRRKLVEAAAEISNAPLFVDDSPSRTMTEIAASARRLKRREGLSLIVIDYLQLIEPDNAKDQRQEQVAKIARRLKGLAREMKIPVLCLAQLNRQAEASRDNKPRLSHLRESGAIEQDADVVMFVHREEYYQTNEEDRKRVAGEAEIIVAKQRNGPIGDIKLTWLHKFTRFENSAPSGYAEFDQFNAGEGF